MHWRKSPVLPFCEYRVRRRAARHVTNKSSAIMPDVVAVGMQAEGQIKIEELPACVCLMCNRLKLLLQDPLGIAMVVPDLFIVVAFADRPIAQTRGPGSPA